MGAVVRDKYQVEPLTNDNEINVYLKSKQQLKNCTKFTFS